MSGKGGKGVAFNLEAFKRRWRELAKERGIDPLEGANSFQVANAKADANKATYTERQTQAVYADAAKPNAWRRYDNGYGAVDTVKVERQASRLWWVYESYWLGGGRRITVLRPNWTAAAVRMTDSPYHRIVIFSLDDAQLDTVISRILPPDFEAIRNLRREARRLEGCEPDELTYKEDKQKLWHEAWREDGAARDRQTVTIAAAPVLLRQVSMWGTAAR